MDILIKSAQPEDWQIIQKLNNQVFLADKDHDDDLDLSWPFSEIGIKYYKELTSGKYGKCFIAYANNEPVGYIALANKNFGYRKSKYLEIENIGVEPKFRSQGIGHLLVEKAGQYAKEIGDTKLFVSAYWQNTQAINFYKKNGFYETGVELDKKL